MPDPRMQAIMAQVLKRGVMPQPPGMQMGGPGPQNPFGGGDTRFIGPPEVLETPKPTPPPPQTVENFLMGRFGPGGGGSQGMKGQDIFNTIQQWLNGQEQNKIIPGGDFSQFNQGNGGW